MPYADLVLGIDGGGSKTIAWLSGVSDAAGSKPVGTGRSGPGNLRAVGFAVASSNFDAAIDAAFHEARLPRDTVASAVFGLAGGDRAVDRRAVTDWAGKRHVAHTVTVTNDAEPILWGAFGEPEGIALISGTGSFAWGQNAAGETHRCGGWGYLLGDEGSGYSMTREALRLATRSADQRGPITSLLDRLMKRLCVDRPHQLIEVLYDTAFTRDRFASLVEVVFAAADENDKAAIEVIQNGAEELAQLVVTLAKRLGMSASSPSTSVMQLPSQLSEFRLAMSGGILVGNVGFRTRVLDAIIRHGLHPVACAIVCDPVNGALAMARRLATNAKVP